MSIRRQLIAHLGVDKHEPKLKNIGKIHVICYTNIYTPLSECPCDEIDATWDGLKPKLVLS